jgi:hypothetical protein
MWMRIGASEKWFPILDEYHDQYQRKSILMAPKEPIMTCKYVTAEKLTLQQCKKTTHYASLPFLLLQLFFLLWLFASPFLLTFSLVSGRSSFIF